MSVYRERLRGNHTIMIFDWRLAPDDVAVPDDAAVPPGLSSFAKWSIVALSVRGLLSLDFALRPKYACLPPLAGALSP